MLNKILLFLTATVLSTGMINAQGVPNPGNIPDSGEQILREQERQEQLLRQNASQRAQQSKQNVKQKSDALLPSESLCFPIKAIEFQPVAVGGSLAQGADFGWALGAANYTQGGRPDTAVNKCLGIDSIGIVVRRVQNAIIESGFVTTRVFLGEQNLQTGKLKLTLVPGRLKAVRFKDPNSKIRSENTIPRREDGLLFLRDIEQGLENLKRVPTVEADFEIVPSTGPDALPGDSDVVINWQQKKPLRYNLSLDDSGSDTTGKYQGAVTLSWDNPFAQSDLFYVTVNKDFGGGIDGPRGTKGYSVHYSVPFGYWEASVNASKNSYYQTVEGASQNYVYSGDSKNVSAKLSHMIFRSDKVKTQWSVSAWARSSKNYIDGTEVGVQRRRTAGWELSLNQQRFIKRAVLDWDITYRQGTGAFNALRAPEEAFGEGASHPRVLKFSTSLNTPFSLGGRAFNYSGRFKSQISNDRLITQDRFAIGSRHTVRGFSGQTSLSGENGWVLRNEFATALGKTRQRIYLGLDFGRVSGPSTAGLLGRSLSGVALGLKGAVKGIQYDVYVARPLNHPDGFGTGKPVFDFNISKAF